MNKILVGAYQFPVDSKNISNNLDRIESIFSLKSIEDFDLLVLPELFSSGFNLTNLSEILELNGVIYNKLKSYARIYQLDICGSLIEQDNNAIFNTMFFWSKDGSLKRGYRKIHLIKDMGEKENFRSGENIKVWKSGLWKWGAAICYDLRFPELFARLSRMGSLGIILPAQWPQKRISHWKTLITARAIESQSVVIGCNSCSDLIGGASMIVDWQGKVITAASGVEEKLIKARLDLTELKKWRENFPVLKDWRMPEVYGY